MNQQTEHQLTENEQWENQQFDIAVIGAGIAGLVAAVTAAEGGVRVGLIDAHLPGGRARTTAREGVLYNTGPHALYLDGHLRRFLVDRRIDPPGGTPDTKHLRLVRAGALHPFTADPSGILRSPMLSRRSRLRVLRLLAAVPRMNTAPFVGVPWQEWLGNEPDDVAGLVEMLVRTGTYVNAPSRFDAAAALDQLKLALRGVRYVDGGWQHIVDALLTRFHALGGAVLAGHPVLHVTTDDRATITTSAGVVTAAALIIAGLGPDAVERITGVSIPGRSGAGGSVVASVLDLAVARPAPGLVFGIDQPLYLSPHAPTARLAPEGTGLVSLMRYTPDGEVGGPSPEAVRRQLSDLAVQSGIVAGDVLHERYLHRLVVANSFPAAAGGGLAGRPTLDALGLPGVLLAGDWVGPTGQLADAAAASGALAGQRALAHIESRRHVAV